MNGSPWTAAQIETLRALFPDRYSVDVAAACGHSLSSTSGMAHKLGVTKSAEFRAMELAKQGARLKVVGAAHRIQPGNVPANKGLRRPGWHRGRMRETQFKKGTCPPNKDPDFYVLGALRVNTAGYIDMRVSFEKGACGWKALHRILWEDVHGPISRTHVLTFRDRDRLNVCLENLEPLPLAQNAQRNRISHLPIALQRSIRLLNVVKRTIKREGARCKP